MNLTIDEGSDLALYLKEKVKSQELKESLEGIIEIGKRDMSNPKYDGYFNSAIEALEKCDGIKRKRY